MRTCRRSLVSLALALALALLTGCGNSSHNSSSSSPSASNAQTSGTGHTSSTGQAASSQHRRGPAKPQSGATRQRGPSPPPDGLRATGGFGTYELCSGACSGSVPSSLRRPLRAPSACSAAPPSGPVKPSPGDPLGVTPFIGSTWKASRVTWNSGGYTGPLLIRGRQVGGSGAVGFGEGHVPYDELQLQGSGPWQSFTRVQSSGCFYYQVDGTNFSETIVFHAR